MNQIWYMGEFELRQLVLPSSLSPLNRLCNLSDPFATLIRMVSFFNCTRLLSDLIPNCRRTFPVQSAILNNKPLENPLHNGMEKNAKYVDKGILELVLTEIAGKWSRTTDWHH